MSISNRRAVFNYEILESLEAGIVLTGAEVKSVKGGHMSLEGSYVKAIGSELYLVNARIHPYSFARSEGYDPKRSRKLLLHKKQILNLKTKLATAKLAIVPIECYNSDGFVKLRIGLAKGKKEFEKGKR